MNMILHLAAALVATAIAGCHDNSAAEAKACNHVDGSYRAAPINLSDLVLTPADQGIEKAAGVIPTCYARRPIGPYENYLKRLGVYTGRNGLYIAYRVAGMTNTLLLFRVNEDGDILDATRTTLPYMTEVR